MTYNYFTSESVSEGHPDKICDRISDEILDYCLKKNCKARCAAEVLVTSDHITIAGEVRGMGITDENGVLPNVKYDIYDLVHDAIKDIGYEQQGFHWNYLNIDFRLHGQSKELAIDDGGAGDQGLMFGYATNETKHFMPAAIYHSHRIVERLSEIRKTNNPGLGPDMKSQVTLKYKNDKISGIENVIVSAQHTKEFRHNVNDFIKKEVSDMLHVAKEIIIVNPRGEFVEGGPGSDTGLTGRKIIVDTYGGAAPHGGGAFSGKDPSKVDRSAAYAGRYLAKNIVAAGLAEKCLIQLSYAIGKKDPTSVSVHTYGTGKIDKVDDKLREAIMESRFMDLTPHGICSHLELNRPIYAPTSSYGHFGRPAKNGFFTWETLTLVDKIQKYFNV